MPRTVDEGFRDFLTKLTPTQSETQTAKTHRASIEASLKSNFEMVRFVRIGSFGNGTSISGFSDVDYLASIPAKHLTESSSYSLEKIKNTLDERFPDTGVEVKCPAIHIPFGTSISETTEVVPADFISRTNDIGLYEIADCDGGWKRASPDAHNNYVQKYDKKFGGKLKSLIRFIKAWKYYNQVPISSFYLELRVAKFAEMETTIVYEFDIKNIFKALYDGKLALMQDPMGISEYISPCSSDAKFKEAYSKLTTAYVRSIKAGEASAKEDIKDAFGWWALVFNYEFPSYYY